MLPHSYALNSHSKSQDLACTILASSAPHQISSTCASIESFLHSLSPDQSRHFFSLTFPTLICKLFGFDDATSSPPSPPQPASQQQPSPSAASASPNGWIDTVLASNDIDLANRLFALLAPSSLLFNAISAVDRLSLVKYVFPIERLPEWVRFMLSSENGSRVLSDLSPIFKNRVKEDSIKPNFYQVQLNVFEYYMFWFAYYPVCRGNSENCDVVSIKRNRRFKFENWVSSISGFSSTRCGAEVKIECNLYIRLLYAYLRAFVGATDLNQHLPYRSSLLHYSSGYDTSVIAQAEVFVNALVNFWLVDNDFSPLPVNLCKSFGVSFPFRSVLGETPPTPVLGEVVKLFVKYLNVGLIVHRNGNDNMEHCGSPRRRGSFDALKLRDVMSVSPCTGSWNLLIQRPLYRFILRTFLFCPVGVSIKNISEVFSVWITYIEPWDISLDDFSELDAVVDGSTKNGRKDNLQPQNHSYTPSWQGYVLASYLYYSSLVMHFIGFAHKFLHTDPEIIVQMVLKILTILTSSKELMDLLKMVDTAFHSKQAGSGKSMLNSLYRIVTPIREQLQDWEDGLSESDADGSFLHENWNKDLRLFSDGEDGGQQLLQLFILRAEAELLAISGDNGTRNLQCVDSLKAQVSCLFGGHTVKVLSFSPEPKQPPQPRDAVFKPRRVGNRTSDDVKYRGDWMKRPISDNEVAWLARLLVEFSSWINERLGLNQSESSQADPTYVEVSSNVLGNVFGPMDTMKAVMGAVGSWLVMLGVAMVKLMRKHGLRVNLRMLASKKVVMVLFLSAVYSILKKAFGMYQRV
ncbi:uncharacterized protein LOC126619609 [Malus sylvestris]|uniref:uncharacterized protein LOC126619609 n=1 Tax=Malus sylvestris TaxID=3752 RepID=UPI0021AC6E49|nr:uncharacterized protein LOC126619609 [Malus sylvestris]